MTQARVLEVSGVNRLLNMIPPGQGTRILSDAETLNVGIKDTIYARDERITHVYFPVRGVISTVLSTREGWSVEIAAIGNEGMVGTPFFLGSDRSPTRVLCQVPGEVIRVPVTSFQRALQSSAMLDTVVRRYIQALINQISQTVLCNHLHTVEQRMCRWLLMAHDRVGSDDFPLTQEFLSQMLGVRRPSVSVVARTLYDNGIIRYTRGKLTIVDRARLEMTACECYGVVKREFDRLMTPGSAANLTIARD